MIAKRAVESTWRGGWRCDVRAGDFVLASDEPESVGGTNSGPQPTELFLASIASCFTLAIVYSARKRSIVLRDLTVTVTGIYDGPRFRTINISSRLGCDPADVGPLVNAAQKVCYVTNTLRSGVELVVEAGDSM
jgi:putative redox protein